MRTTAPWRTAQLSCDWGVDRFMDAGREGVKGGEPGIILSVQSPWISAQAGHNLQCVAEGGGGGKKKHNYTGAEKKSWYSSQKLRAHSSS